MQSQAFSSQDVESRKIRKRSTPDPNGSDTATNGTAQSAQNRAIALGWFSIGLGAAQILAPRGLSRLIGTGDTERARTTMLALGLREIASGIGILTNPRPSGWLWSRVVGDVMDLALLGEKLVSSDASQRPRIAAASAAVLGVTLLDAQTAIELGRHPSASQRGKPKLHGQIHLRRAITVNRSPEEVYAFWHDFENLPRFMAHLESVKVTDGRSHWRAKGPAGTSVEWEAEMVVDRPHEVIAWRSLPDATVSNYGSVQFIAAPRGQGTEVHVELFYDPPGGAIGSTIAKLFGEEPGQQIEGDLRRFKQVLETGEVVHSDASIHRGLHPARPPKTVPNHLRRS
jgi:uncharacterized membrane protein